MALVTSKACDKIWYAGLLHKRKGDDVVTGRIIDIIQSFFTNRVIKDVLNGYASVSFHINSSVHSGYLIGPTLYFSFSSTTFPVSPFFN